MACFNLRTATAYTTPTHSSPRHSPRHSHWEDLAAVKRRFVAVRRQPEGALHLEVGFKSRAGRDSGRGERPNQDAVAVVVPVASRGGHCSLFAVFDGHGRYGERAASFAAQRLVSETLHALENMGDEDCDAVLRTACTAVDDALRNESGLDLMMTGSTATVCLINDTEVTCANIGDSRIVLASYDPRAPPLELTEDHVPSRSDERKRIEINGGRVDSWAPGGMDTGPPRVYLSTKRLPGLAVSRALGDTILDGIISSSPDLTSVQLHADHSFIVCASDGIWSMMSSRQVVDFVARRRSTPAQKVAENLVKHAAGLWATADEGGSDDISVIIIYLQWQR